MYKYRFNKNQLKHFLIALFIAFIGGILFSYLKAPIPWLLGSMTATLIGSRIKKFTLYWPKFIRETGLIIVGYSIGLSFTRSALVQIAEKLPSMIFLTVTLVLFCAVIAYFISKLTGVDYPTVLTGSIPGGLNQMITFAEEMKGIDITTVTFLQVSRLIMIIFTVPFLVFSPIFSNAGPIRNNGHLLQSGHSEHHFFPIIFLFFLICILFAFLGKKIKSPTPFLLGPILGTAILSLIGLHGPALPSGILNFSQFMIGGYIGLLLKPEKLEHKTKIISLALISGIVMVGCSLVLSMILIYFDHISPSTSLLSLAPGGMDQMGIMAHEVHADLSMVTGYQIFRLFFIYFAVPPMLRWIFKLNDKRSKQTA